MGLSIEDTGMCGPDLVVRLGRKTQREQAERAYDSKLRNQASHKQPGAGANAQAQAGC